MQLFQLVVAATAVHLEFGVLVGPADETRLSRSCGFDRPDGQTTSGPSLNGRFLRTHASLQDPPDPKRRVTRSVLEVPISRKHLQVVVQAEPNQKGIDGPELNTVAPAPIADVSGRDVIVAIRDDHR